MTYRRVVVLWVFAVVVAACAPGGTEADGPSGTGTLPESAGVVSKETGLVLSELCAGSSVELLADRGLVDAEALARLSGEEGASEGSGVDVEATFPGSGPDVGLCSVEVSPSARTVLDAVDRAVAEGDLDEARRLLEEIVEGKASASAPSGGVFAVGVLAAGVLAAATDSADAHLQGARDALAAAEKAEELGMDDAADDAWETAREEFAAYLDGDDDHAGAIETTNDTGELLELAAQATLLGLEEQGQEALTKAQDTFAGYLEGSGDQPGAIERTNDPRELLRLAAAALLLGLEELGEEALAKALSILQAELDELTEKFSPCDAGRKEVERLETAATKVKLLGGDASGAVALYEKALEIQRRRAAGEDYIPECDAAATISAQATSSFEGVRVELTADLRTCDGTTWTGLFEHRFVDPPDTEGVAVTSGAITATSDVEVELPAPSGSATTSIVFVFGGEVSATVEGYSATFSYSGTGIGTFSLTVDREAGTAVIVVEGEPTSISENDGFETYPWPHPGASGRLEADVVGAEACD